MSSYCDTLETIPQFQGTCWFNAIMTCLLYSDGLRRIVKKVAVEENWMYSKEIIKQVLNRILIYIDGIRNETSIEKRKILNNKLNKYLNTVKPELILIKFLKTYHLSIYDNLKIRGYDDFGYYNIYMIFILYILNIKYLCIVYDDIENIEFLRTQDFSLDSNDYIIILITTKLKKFIEDNYGEILSIHIHKYETDDKEKELISSNLNIINLFKKTFIIDSSIIIDFTKREHSIAGITCGANKYVYNGYGNLSRKTESNLKKSCYLSKFDWNNELINETSKCFILDKNCNLPITMESFKYHCFLFGSDKIKNNRLLIYTQIPDTDIIISSQRIHSSISSPIDKYISNAYELVYNYVNVDKYKDINEIKLVIKKYLNNYISRLSLIYIYMNLSYNLFTINFINYSYEELLFILVEFINNNILTNIRKIIKYKYYHKLYLIIIQNIYYLLLILNKIEIDNYDFIYAKTIDELLIEITYALQKKEVKYDINLLIYIYYHLWYINRNIYEIKNLILMEEIYNRVSRINDITTLRNIMKNVVYYYYIPYDNNNNLFYSIYRQIYINPKLLDDGGYMIYKPTDIGSSKYKNMYKLNIKELVKIILQFFQVYKLYQLVDKYFISNNFFIDDKEIHIFYLFICDIYKKLNKDNQDISKITTYPFIIYLSNNKFIKINSPSSISTYDIICIFTPTSKY